MSEISIEITDLKKKFQEIEAVKGINLRIPKGKIFGFLGPNGAGKSTTISMMATLLKPSSGDINILGYNLSEKAEIKHLIGLCPQDLVFYELLTARENLYLIAEMHGMNKSEYKSKADELLSKMNLLERANHLVKTYSGGMKRRLNVLMAVIHNPDVIFFDEPSAGLDPQSRRAVWDFIRDFEKDNKTVILTTHNMDEADDLCDELAIIDNGNIIAQGTPSELKAKLGEGDVIEFYLDDSDIKYSEEIIEKLKKIDYIKWVKSIGRHRIVLSANNGLNRFSELYNEILKENITPQNISIRQNTLEDVFIELTGRKLRE